MISHHHKCIFVHIPKNAGQSIEHVFVESLGLEWNTRAPLLLRYNNRSELGPPRLAHLLASEYVGKKYLTQEMFDSYFKFSFVRNPWDRMISLYRYMGYDKKYEFKTFLQKIGNDKLWEDKHWFVRPQSDFLFSYQNQLMVDFIGRFEQLQIDFDTVCHKLGIPPIRVPHVNQTSQGKKRVSLKPNQIYWNIISKMRSNGVEKFAHYQDYYDLESREIVADLYHRDIENFNYSFTERP